MDHVLNYMEENNIPVNRKNYIEINWMGDIDPSSPSRGIRSRIAFCAANQDRKKPKSQEETE